MPVNSPPQGCTTWAPSGQVCGGVVGFQPWPLIQMNNALGTGHTGCGLDSSGPRLCRPSHPQRAGPHIPRPHTLTDSERMERQAGLMCIVAQRGPRECPRAAPTDARRLWARTTEAFSLPVPETKRLKSRCPRVTLPPEALWMVPRLVQLPRAPGVLGLWSHHSSLPFSSHSPLPRCLTGTLTGSKAHLNPGGLILVLTLIASETIFPNASTVTGSGGHVFGGHHSAQCSRHCEMWVPQNGPGTRGPGWTHSVRGSHAISGADRHRPGVRRAGPPLCTRDGHRALGSSVPGPPGSGLGAAHSRTHRRASNSSKGTPKGNERKHPIAFCSPDTGRAS